MGFLQDMVAALQGQQPQDRAAAHGEAMGRAARARRDAGIDAAAAQGERNLARRPSRPIPMPRQAGRFEDSGYIQGQQGLVPMDADVAHLRVGNQGLQGYPSSGRAMSNNVSNQGLIQLPMGQGRIQPSRGVRWQNTDGMLRNMINPQVRDDGYYYN